MKKVLIIIGLCFVFFVTEFLLFNLFGKWFKPDLLVLLIIFFNISSGIRYSLVTALSAGIFQDSFSLSPFGSYIVTYIVCVFVATLVRRYLFHADPYAVRILLAFIITSVQAIILYAINLTFVSVDINEFIMNVLIPEVLMTTIVANFTFRYLKQCVSKFYA